MDEAARPGGIRRAELAAFLRGRRARLRPGEVGLPGGGRRRTPGLRRQEVAELAGMSVDYYIRLEQARGPRPSEQILAALARALMLTRDERDYLFRMAGVSPPPAASAARKLDPATRHLLDSLADTPAYVLDARYDVLAWNQLAIPLHRRHVRGPGSGPERAALDVPAARRRPTVERRRHAGVRPQLGRGPARGVRPLPG